MFPCLSCLGVVLTRPRWASLSLLNLKTGSWFSYSNSSFIPFLRKDDLLVRWLDGGELDRVKVVIENRYPLLGLRKEVGWLGRSGWWSRNFFLASVAKFDFAQQAARSDFCFALAAPISVDSGPTLPRQIQLYPTLPGPVESLTPSLDWSNLLYQLGPVEDHARVRWSSHPCFRILIRYSIRICRWMCMTLLRNIFLYPASTYFYQNEKKY